MIINLRALILLLEFTGDLNVYAAFTFLDDNGVSYQSGSFTVIDL